MEQREKACHFLAHDGFVEGNDMPRNFAEPGKQTCCSSRAGDMEKIIYYNICDQIPQH